MCVCVCVCVCVCLEEGLGREAVLGGSQSLCLRKKYLRKFSKDDQRVFRVKGNRTCKGTES